VLISEFRILCLVFILSVKGRKLLGSSEDDCGLPNMLFSQEFAPVGLTATVGMP